MIFEVGALGDRLSDHAVSATVGGIVKLNTKVSPHEVANDFIASRLGLAIGLPIPPGAMLTTSEGVGYLSLRFSSGRERPPPGHDDELAEDHPSIVAGLVVFDTWIDNWDRWQSNFAYSRHHDIPPAAFDHGVALLGRPDEPPMVNRIAEGVRQSVLTQHVRSAHDLAPWIQRVRSVTRAHIELVVAEAVRYRAVEPKDGKAVAAFLVRRKNDLESLLWDSEQLPNVTDWY